MEVVDNLPQSDLRIADHGRNAVDLAVARQNEHGRHAGSQATVVQGLVSECRTKENDGVDQTLVSVEKRMHMFDKDGVSNDTWRRDTDHFIQGYTGQLASFAKSVREGKLLDGATGHDARQALAIALACIDSIQKKSPVPVK